MSSFPQCSGLDGATTMRPLLNTPNPTQQVVIMAQSPPSVKPKVDYTKRISKEFMLLLSCLQLLSGFLAITTEIVFLTREKYNFFATGIYCGILYGLSGFIGVFASLRPAKSTIVSFMVMTIISSLFCLPGLVIPSIIMWPHLRHNAIDDQPAIGHAMLVMQMVIAIVQAVAAVASSVITCKAICHCCRPMREDRAVRYTYYPGSSATNIGMANQPNVLFQQQPSYVTIPMSQVQTAEASGGSMTVATIPQASASDTVQSSAPAASAPPKYEECR